jgi:hypothetical protein
MWNIYGFVKICDEHDAPVSLAEKPWLKVLFADLL